jgi:hypothetical protein
MQKKSSAVAIALALGAVLCAFDASALRRVSLVDAETCTVPQICLTENNANLTWGDDPDEDVIIIDKPIFITQGAKLTILPGVTVRGTPRGSPVEGTEIGGTPGMLVVTRTGEADWQGDASASGVVIFTTAATDNNNDLQPDNFDGRGNFDPYPGFDPALSGAPAGNLPCTCGTNGTAALADDCVGTDLILGTGDDSLGNCVVDATPTFHDANPRTAPLAPLTPPISPDPGVGPDGINGTYDDTGGEANVQLWGGIVVLGKAPTNTAGATPSPAADGGDDIAEGLVIPGWPEDLGIYGGTEVHDSSGIFRYLSVRHAGDEIGASNELNGFTLGAVGDGTVFEFNEVYANFDDGFEWFGGTMRSNNLVVALVGDDSFDMDQGYTGTLQFGVSVSPNFNEHDCVTVDGMGIPNCVGAPDGGDGMGNAGGAYGSSSGDKAGELDGEDCTGDCNQGSLRDSRSSLVGAVPNGNRAPTVISGGLFYNLTHVGNAELTNKVAFTPEYGANSECVAVDNPFDCCTGANAGTCEAADNSGINLHNGFVGEIRNSVIVNTGTAQGIVLAGGGATGWTVGDNACAPEEPWAITGPNGDLDNGSLVRSVATLYDDVAEVAGSYPQPNVAYTSGAPTVVGTGASNPAAGACLGDTTQVLENGNAIHGVGVSTGGNLVNPTASGVLDLTNEDTTFKPYGNASGELDSSLKASPIDLRPQSSTGYVAGIAPGGHPVKDSTVQYKGAFDPGSTDAPWTDGWTVLSIADLW